MHFQGQYSYCLNMQSPIFRDLTSVAFLFIFLLPLLHQEPGAATRQFQLCHRVQKVRRSTSTISLQFGS